MSEITFGWVIKNRSHEVNGIEGKHLKDTNKYQQL
jgi:hypothetical protein